MVEGELPDSLPSISRLADAYDSAVGDRAARGFANGLKRAVTDLRCGRLDSTIGQVRSQAAYLSMNMHVSVPGCPASEPDEYDANFLAALLMAKAMTEA